MKLWFVLAQIDGDDLDWFVRASSPREAFQAWTNEETVSDYDINEPITIMEVPPVEGPAGAVNWPINGSRYVGCKPEHFPS